MAPIVSTRPAIAYVLISCELGCQTAVIDELRVLPGVMEASEIYGSTYDIIAKITGATQDKLKETIRNYVRRIEKVRATQTMMVVMTV
jgi:DNA-binding Lrp family transcriptional regulator